MAEYTVLLSEPGETTRPISRDYLTLEGAYLYAKWLVENKEYPLESLSLRYMKDEGEKGHLTIEPEHLEDYALFLHDNGMAE